MSSQPFSRRVAEKSIGVWAIDLLPDEQHTECLGVYIVDSTVVQSGLQFVIFELFYTVVLGLPSESR